MTQQTTLGQSISCSGVGLHSGHPVTVTLRPAPPDTGIVFVRRDKGEPVRLKASISNLMASELCTALQNNGTSVRTVEHMLAALVGLEVDNVFVDLDAGEVPAMDGSAGPFVKLIKAAGRVPQDRVRSFLKIVKPIQVVDGDRRVIIEPCATSRISYSIHYDHPLIRKQGIAFDFSVNAFEKEIAGARTFGFLKEVEELWARGLGKGGSLDNTVVLADRDVLNTSGLRYDDEFVRHKVLDLIGDLALLGRPFIGHLIADRSGHALHTKLVEQILQQTDSWILVPADHSAADQSTKVALNSLGQPSKLPLSVPSAL
ncbi:MAG: UDP-3-O-acyl-N-acetylglucosamine deacetylase [Nitrospiraceae bacterium]